MSGIVEKKSSIYATKEKISNEYQVKKKASSREPSGELLAVGRDAVYSQAEEWTAPCTPHSERRSRKVERATARAGRIGQRSTSELNQSVHELRVRPIT